MLYYASDIKEICWISLIKSRGQLDMNVFYVVLLCWCFSPTSSCLKRFRSRFSQFDTNLKTVAEFFWLIYIKLWEMQLYCSSYCYLTLTFILFRKVNPNLLRPLSSLFSQAFVGRPLCLMTWFPGLRALLTTYFTEFIPFIKK